MSTIDEYLYIDYENVQDVKVKTIKSTMKVKIIAGENQVKIPLELVQKTQPLGDKVEWIKVSGKGKNALDFFIVYYLGRDVERDKSKSFIIYSKDAGYDPLISHLNKLKIKARRIVSFQELNENVEIDFNEKAIKKSKDILLKVAGNKRPKKRTSLTKFIASHFVGLPIQDINKIIDDLFIKKMVYEENGIIKYSLS